MGSHGELSAEEGHDQIRFRKLTLAGEGGNDWREKVGHRCSVPVRGDSDLA